MERLYDQWLSKIILRKMNLQNVDINLNERIVVKIIQK